MKSLFATVLLSVVTSLAISPCQAEELDPTLRKIKSSQTIVFGFHPQSFPLSYLDDRKVPVGYARDLTAHITQAIKQHLNLAKLEPASSLITYRNRFDHIAIGVIDIECNSTTNTLERQRQFAFSNSFFVATTRLLTRKDSGIKDFQDLAGRRVLTASNSTSEILLKRFGAEKKVAFETILWTDMSAPPLTQLESGHVDAYMMDDIVLYGLISNAFRPQDWIVTGTPMSREAYGCMMRKDSPVFKAVVDRAVADWMRSGKAALSYKKWFQSPIPPADANLNFPVSPEVESLFRNPNDRAFE